MKILIRNGRVVDPASGRDEAADVAIAAGRIVAIGKVPADFAPDRTIEADGCVVAPGLVDLAARLKEPGPGALESELAAAAAGGVTSSSSDDEALAKRAMCWSETQLAAGWAYLARQAQHRRPEPPP